MGYYMSQQDSSVYAFRERVGSGEIVYVNLYPIINSIEKADEKSFFYEILGKLLKPANITLEPFSYTPPPLMATFNYVNATGKIEMHSSSMIFPLNINFKRVEITDWNYYKRQVSNITKLVLANYSYVQIDTSNLTIGDGKGFYSTLSLKDNVTVKIEGNAYAVVSTADGNATQFTNVKEMTIENDEPITLYLREPTIKIDGAIFLKELYSSGSIYQKTRTYGQDLKIMGSVEMTIYMSDRYSWASWIDVSGSFERNPPLLAYDETSSLPQAVFWSIILAPIFLTMLFIIHRGKRR
jgi:hypothetical protein